LPEQLTDNIKQLPRESSVFNKIPVRQKLAFCFSLILIFTSLAFWLIFQSELKRSLSEHMEILGASLSNQAAFSVREFVLVNDLLALNVALAQMAQDDNILYVAIHDVDDSLIANAGSRPKGTSLSNNTYTANITVQDTIAGSVRLTLNSSVVADYQAQLRTLFFLILAVALGISVATAFVLGSTFTRPILELTGRLSSRAERDTGIIEGDETRQLSIAADSLLDEFDQIKEKLQETGVWHQADESNTAWEASRQAAAILIIKVVNINTAIELLHPTTLSNLLREYIFYLTQSVRLYGGEVQRINGDSTLISFSAERCKDRHSINALLCAGLFQALMARINSSHREKGKQILEYRLALHSGDVFLSPVTSSSESADAVLGKTIDIASFLSKQAEPNQLIISEFAFSQAKAFDHFETAGQRKISMPADNVSFMAYIVDSCFISKMDTVRKQCAHILGESFNVGPIRPAGGT